MKALVCPWLVSLSAPASWWCDWSYRPPDTFRARKMIDTARTLKPDMETVVRTHSDDAAALLRREHVGAVVFMGEQELALGMTRHVLERVAK